MRKRINQPSIFELIKTDIQRVAPDTPLNDVVQLLVRENLPEIPVLTTNEANQEWFGSISERDCLEFLSNDAFYHSPNVTAKSVIKPLPKGVTVETDIFTVASKLISQESNYLPVIDQNKCLGVLNRQDVLKGLHAYRVQITQAISQKKSPPDTSEIANHRFIVKRN